MKPFDLKRGVGGYSLAVASIAAIAAPYVHADTVQAQTTQEEVINMPEVVVTMQQLDAARNGILPETGSSIYRFDQAAIADMPLGDSTPLNQVLLQAPGVAQDSYGQLHIRGDHANLQYRINGVVIPESISGFGQALDARFFDSVNLLTGALPAQYGLRTAGIVDIHTKSGDLNPGGGISLLTGQYGTLNPSLEYGGTNGNLDYYFTGQFLHNDLGIESPTGSRNALHDTTNQAKAFGYLSYLLDANSRVSLFLGASVNRFQIPDNTGQTPSFPIDGVALFPNLPSSQLKENQSEKTDYAVLAYQGKFGASVDYQVSAFSRYTETLFTPDTIGDLIYNGTASRVLRSNFSNGVQSDFSNRINDTHTVRYGLAASQEHAVSDNTSSVFLTDNAGVQLPGGPVSITDNASKDASLQSIYIQDEWLLTDALTVNYGLRADHIAAYTTEGQISPRIGAVYKLTPQTTIHAGYARYFTPPPTELVSSSSIALFQNTTNAPEVTQNDPVKAERSNYYDLGITYNPTSSWTIGLDGYYKESKNLIDEGQFGQALVFTPFNYSQGKVYGLELTNTYRQDNVGAYFNIASSRALGKNIESAQFNFGQDELAYIANNWVHLDHDQSITASAGVSYRIEKTTLGADVLLGSGLRAGFANTGHLPAYATANLSASRNFDVAGAGHLNAKVALLNVFDRDYEIRDGSGIGVGAPQFGQRRALLVTVGKDF
ncbi:MAG TPA: TonB-dependent receptor [Methylophilaceae bacterium]